MRLGIRRIDGGLLALGAAGLAFALSGCGGSSVAPTTLTPPVKPTFALVSPALPKTHVLPAQYACNPKVGVPPLKWGALPAKTAGLALVVFSSRGGPVSAQAALTGLKPTLHELKPGVIPHGAVIASGSKVICPSKGFQVTYFIRVYALKSLLKLAPGATVNTVVSAVFRAAIAAGSLEVHYRRA
jgi:hypothetical protein